MVSFSVICCFSHLLGISLEIFKRKRERQREKGERDDRNKRGEERWGREEIKKMRKRRDKKKLGRKIGKKEKEKKHEMLGKEIRDKPSKN